MKDQVTLRPGDYVSTKGLTEDDYHAVARAFEMAGCPRFGGIGAGKGSGDFLEWYQGELVSTSAPEAGGRHLTPQQVVNATNATKRKSKMGDDFKLKCILHSAQRYLEEEQEQLELAKFHSVKAAQLRENHEERMQQAREMLPDGWRLVRAEDMAEAVSVDAGEWMKGSIAPTQDMSNPANWREGDVVVRLTDRSPMVYTKGEKYFVKENDGTKVSIYDNLGKPSYCKARYGFAADHFTFHHRP